MVAYEWLLGRPRPAHATPPMPSNQDQCHRRLAMNRMKGGACDGCMNGIDRAAQSAAGGSWLGERHPRVSPFRDFANRSLYLEALDLGIVGDSGSLNSIKPASL